MTPIPDTRSTRLPRVPLRDGRVLRHRVALMHAALNAEFTRHTSQMSAIPQATVPLLRSAHAESGDAETSTNVPAGGGRPELF
jgi:hypothetical protein